MDPILAHHYTNLAQGKSVKNDDGSVSTVYTSQIDVEGVPTLIPRVWDGEILTDQDAAKRALDSGVKWPTAETHEALRAHDVKLHEDMTDMTPREAQQFLEVIKAGKGDVL
jgi:hypothetical protein